MALLGIIRRWHIRDQVPLREIARRLGISRNTVRRYLRSETTEPSYADRRSPSAIDKYAFQLSELLKTEAAKSRKQRRTLKQLHEELKGLGFEGSYDRVAAFARVWRAGQTDRVNSASKRTGKPNKQHRVIVLDAGAPLWRGFGMSSLNPFRLKRLMDVMMDQNRALRVRGFINYVVQSKEGGYLGIVRTPNLRDAIKKQSGEHFMSNALASQVASFPTSLRRLSEENFDLIAQHGYETAKLTQIEFPYLPLRPDLGCGCEIP